jgi:hypothetical protein
MLRGELCFFANGRPIFCICFGFPTKGPDYEGSVRNAQIKFADDMSNTSKVLRPSADAHRAVRNDDGGSARGLKEYLAPSGRRSLVGM